MPLKAKIYITAVAATGLSLLVWQLCLWHSAYPLRYLAFLVVGIFASALRVTLPAITGTLTVNFLFILFGIVELSLPETLALACSITGVQCIWAAKRNTRIAQIVFNVGIVSIATTLAHGAYRSSAVDAMDTALRLAVAATVFFTANTVPVAIVIALTEHRPVRKVWNECYFWSFPYYVIGAAIAALMSAANRYVGWQTALLVIPIVYLIYRLYGFYLGRLEDQKEHAEQMAALHLRTIEALALAIEAKDHHTHDHLERIEIYSVEIGKELGLNAEELEALRAASLLHDIGKLAVPEHIVSKPGPLTPEEFEKMKIHAAVGAEILERVRFPYPVGPIVRCHHERWDGLGYPAGLAGEQIPIGARILAAVDCLHSLASDRLYRSALPLEEAMRHVVAESGNSFDPRVIETLERRYADLERLAQAAHNKTPLSMGMKISNGHAPAAGFEQLGPVPSAGTPQSGDFLQSIAAARQEVQALFELAQDLGNSLSLDETLSVLTVRLRRMIPCDAIAIYIRRDNVLIPEYVAGDDFRLFSSLEIPMGQGLSGWVAENRKPIVNGNPSVEPGYLNDPVKFSKLRSALSVPLEGLNGILGALSLYRAERDAFSRDHLRMLHAISSKVALSVENALRFRQAEDSATIDYLTQLPNARSLFLHLDAEMARAAREKQTVALLVCDLDGFKQINDRFGHLEGNKVLRNVAHAFKDNCRDYDFVARMGGDEFVLVLPGLTPESVAERCQRLRQAVIEAGRDVCGTDVLDVSIGRAFYSEDGEDAEELLALADHRMYAQKQQNKERRPGTREAWSHLPAGSVHCVP
jgi:diguanylate cyclase (GGDEF)-like protein/putative nucleotidyltransferase with HDIG domain